MNIAGPQHAHRLAAVPIWLLGETEAPHKFRLNGCLNLIAPVERPISAIHRYSLAQYSAPGVMPLARDND